MTTSGGELMFLPFRKNHIWYKHKVLFILAIMQLIKECVCERQVDSSVPLTHSWTDLSSK